MLWSYILHLIVSLQFAPSSYGQAQMTVIASAGTQYQLLSQMSTPAAGQTGASGSQSSASVAPLHQAREQPIVTTAPVPVRTVTTKLSLPFMFYAY